MLMFQAMPWSEKDDTGSVSKLLPNMSVRYVYIHLSCRDFANYHKSRGR